jgi:hypothetical protein
MSTHEIPRTQYSLYAILALLIVPNIGLFTGYSWARWVLSTYMAALLAFVLRQAFVNTWGVGMAVDVALSLVAAAILVTLHRRETRECSGSPGTFEQSSATGDLPVTNNK